MEDTAAPCPIIIRLCEAMQSSGVEKTDLRKLITQITGVSKQNLQHWFNGNTKSPGVDHLAKLAEHFHIDLNWLITGQSRESSRENSNNTNNISPALKNDVIDRLCEGMHQSGIIDIEKSLIKTASEILGLSYEVIREWLDRQTEPSFQQIASLCEFYGIALRYVALGKGPLLALDYIRAVENKNIDDSSEVIRLQDVALLGNV